MGGEARLRTFALWCHVADQIKTRFYPEYKAGGFTSADGTVEFYQRVNALIERHFTVLDFGAGRGAWYDEDVGHYRRKLRTIRGKVRSVVGCDVDRAVLQNGSLDDAVLLDGSGVLPFDDSSFNLVVADYVLEHISDPAAFSKELDRILAPGGWFCARTPNKYGYTALTTRIIPNKYHSRILRFVQPSRREVDVFPTVFKINSASDLEQFFPKQYYEHFSYRYEVEPAYHFDSRLIYAFCLFLNRLLPDVMKSTMMVFLRKK